MQTPLRQWLEAALAQLQTREQLPPGDLPAVQLERTRDPAHGDLATNIALQLAKPARKPPREIAALIVEALDASPRVERVEIAGPGFINLFLNADATRDVLRAIVEQGEAFGRQPADSGQRIQIEFVSANPTGPLHVGHGRGAAWGATVANLLEATGHTVHREYYVNDAGRQMDILAISVWLRYLEQCGETLSFPDNGYQGAYIIEYARALHADHGQALHHPADTVFEGLPPDATDGGDKEAHIDALVARAQTLLGDDYRHPFEQGLQGILADIRNDLAAFGVHYDEWFSERSLTAGPDRVARAIRQLRDAGHVVERDGALWFLATRFGDDKDRVVQRDNGQTTYFASDIAYHLNKFERGFDRVINVWGADHHGYMARVRAALEALGQDPGRLDIRLVQFVSLYRGDQPVSMSTRSGQFITLRELREEVGRDAARFFYITRKAEQPTDFDLELAKSQSKDNPVYYIQYAHARVYSVMRKLADTGRTWDPEHGLAHLDRLDDEQEKQLIGKLDQYPEVLGRAAAQCEPHTLAQYLRELAGDFHAYYAYLAEVRKTPIIHEPDDALRNARLTLSAAVRQVIGNGLTLLGVDAPERM